VKYKNHRVYHGFVFFIYQVHKSIVICKDNVHSFAYVDPRDMLSDGCA